MEETEPDSALGGAEPSGKKLLDRVKDIIIKPREEWEVIAAEPANPKSLYLGYVMILAAIPAVATFIGLWLVGVSYGPLHFRFSFGRSLADAIVMYVLTLVGVYVLALIIDALAPSFDGEKSRAQALKLAVYSYTPAWLIGIVMIWPMLSWLRILGLYGLFLLFLGLPVLMKAPKEKALGYTVVVIVAMIVIYIVIGLLAGLALGGASGFAY